MSTETKPDMWDNAGPFWYRIMPAETIETFVSGDDTDLLKISYDEELRTYWLEEAGRSGQSEFPTLEAAKEAGDEVMDELYERQYQTLTQDAGLDPSEWRFSHQNDYVWFESVSDAVDPPVSIVREGRDRWVLMVGDIAGPNEFRTAKEGAEFVAQRQAFSPTI